MFLKKNMSVWILLTFLIRTRGFDYIYCPIKSFTEILSQKNNVEKTNIENKYCIFCTSKIKVQQSHMYLPSPTQYFIG